MEDFALQTGTVLGGSRYRIEERKAAGGFGMVYAAWDTLRGERVAVKELFWREHCLRGEDGAVRLIRQEDAQEYASVRAAFAAEAQTLVRLERVPGIVHCRDAFEENGTAYIVMDDVAGVTLSKQNRERAKDAKPDAAKLMRQFVPLMESLAMVHDAGYIHRDVSPENIIVSPEGKLTLIDFGSSGTYQREEEARFTTIAKDGFAPEEQYREGARQGPYSDVYGLCATLYACLTGTVPDSARARRIMDDLKPPSALGVKVTPEIEAVIMRGLMVDSAKRFADMRSLLAAVHRALRARHIRTARTCAIAVLLAAVLGLAAWGVSSLVTDDASAPGNRIQAVWENPMWLSDAGNNQVRASALQGETGVYLFDFYSLEEATQGERDDLLRILRQRLDALGVPYALSTQTEDTRKIAVRIAPERVSDFVLATLTANYLYITGEKTTEDVSLSYSRYEGASELTVADTEDGGYALRCDIGEAYSLDELLEGMRQRGEDTLYLRDGAGNAVAQASLADLKDGVIEFTALRFDGAEAMNADTRFVADYIDVLLNQPQLPHTGSLAGSEALDGEGLAKENASADGGMRLPRTAGDLALLDVLRAVYQGTGYPCYENSDGTIFVCADLPVDENLPQNAAEVVENLLGSYPLSGQVYNHSVIIQLIDEADDERCRVALSQRIALDDTPGEENEITGYLFASARLEPYQAAFEAWWQSLPDVYHGFSVSR